MAVLRTSKVLYCEMCGDRLQINKTGSIAKLCPSCRAVKNKRPKFEAPPIQRPRPKIQDSFAFKSTCAHQDCMYYSPSTATCDYRILTGQGRGDKGGNECTKYATGERPRLPWELVYGKEWEDE